MNNDKPSLDNIIKRQMSVRSRLMWRQIRKYLITGVLVTAPIAITLYLAYVFVVFVDTQVAKLLPNDWQPEYGHSIFPGSGLIITIAFFIAIGWFATNFIGRLLIEYSEYIMVHVPILRTIYNGIKQIIESILGSQTKAFREVVMIEYPRKGTWTLGFVTGVAEGEIKDSIKAEDLVNVFIPTAPSPVNGFLLFVPRADIIPLQMTVEEGIKMVISIGILTPQDRREAALLEQAKADNV